MRSSSLAYSGSLSFSIALPVFLGLSKTIPLPEICLISLVTSDSQARD